MKCETARLSARKWVLNLTRAALLTMLAQAVTLPAVGAAVTIYPTITSMTSSADRMISYRNQQHSWQTTDGAIHIMINRGNVDTGDALALFSSYDGGVTWLPMFTLAGTDQFSTSDGILANLGTTGTNLLLTYATAQSTGMIMYVSATYNSAAHSWTVAPAQVAFSSPNVQASNPAFANDTVGNFWCGFTAENLTTLQYQEMMVMRLARGATWTTTTLVFGSINSSTQHSSRPVTYTNGIAMLYQDGLNMYWAYRLTAQPVNTPWVTTLVFVGLPPYNEDPYGTHYSVIADTANNLHMAIIANMQLIYMRYLNSTGVWGPPRALTTTTINAAYSQATLAGGNLMLMVNNLSSLEVFQSTDSGNTFTLTQALRHVTPPPGSTLDYTNPRVEAPGRSTSPVPVFQQFANAGTQGLMFFQVPVVK